MMQRILLIGASVRAAAQSAARAGFAPLAIDLFADRDLRAVADARRVSPYPGGLLRAAEAFPDVPLVYTGALENYPAIVDALARRRTLWGNAGEVLRAVRDPLQVEKALSAAGISVPRVSLRAGDVPRDGTWLRKPRHGGGGGGIVVWDGTAAPVAGGSPDHATKRESFYFQQRVDGAPCAAVYVACGGRAVLLGVTRQLVGMQWTGATDFHYCGSIGPLSLSDDARTRFERLGQQLAADFALVGLFGVDAVVASDAVWPVEINPRYVASVEVLERALGVSAIAWHVAACRDGRLPAIALGAPRHFAGKAVLFARQDLYVPERLAAWAESQNSAIDWPAMADIPDPGSPVAAGRPVMTVLAAASDPPDVEPSLRARAAEVDLLLGVQRRPTTAVVRSGEGFAAS